jgi:hypothetical protein
MSIMLYFVRPFKWIVGLFIFILLYTFCFHFILKKSVVFFSGWMMPVIALPGLCITRMIFFCNLLVIMFMFILTFAKNNVYTQYHSVVVR